MNYVLGLASRQRPNKVGVMIGMDGHAQEKQVSFIGSRRCAHSCGALRLVEGRHHHSGKTADARHVCGHRVAKVTGGEDEEGRGENRPPGSQASKASLTESI